MHQRHNHVERTALRPHRGTLVFLSACFTLGAGAGCLLASFFQKGSFTHLFSYLNGYFSILQSSESSGNPLISTFWEICRWPLFAGLMGTTLFGVVAVPALLVLRSFLLSYAVSVFVCLYGGWYGLLLSLSLFGVPALCSVVSLTMIGWNILFRHFNPQKGKGKDEKRLVSSILFILIWLVAGTIFQHWISPALLSRLTISIS